jgi:thioredoxin-related protein
MRFRLPLLLLVASLAALAFRPVGVSPSAIVTGPKINWISFKEAYELNQKAPRKMVIDVYTSWCGWCKVMDQRTFSQPAIIDYVNKNYYAVKLDAEQKEDITVGNQTFKFQGQAHELAINLLQGKMGYPTTVFMNEKGEVIQPISGYLEPRMFHQIITYFGGNYQAKEPFDSFKTGTYVKEFQAAM